MSNTPSMSSDKPWFRVRYSKELRRIGVTFNPGQDSGVEYLLLPSECNILRFWLTEAENAALEDIGEDAQMLVRR